MKTQIFKKSTIDFTKLPEHCPLGPSGASRWFSCSGAPALIRVTKPLVETNEAAILGTKAHKYLENYIRAFIEHKDEVVIPEGIDETSINAVKRAYTHLHDNYMGKDTIFYDAERKYGYDPINKGLPLYGTVDFICLKKLEDGAIELVVADYKNGDRVKVLVKNNTQTLYYAYLILANLEQEVLEKITKITTIILQPRMGHISTETITVGEFAKWGEKLTSAVTKATKLYLKNEMPNDKDLVQNEENCKYCDAIAVCPKNRKDIEKAMDFIPQVKPHLKLDPKKFVLSLNPKNILDVYTKSKKISKFLDSLDKEIKHRVGTNPEKYPDIDVKSVERSQLITKNPEDLVTLLKRLGCERANIDQVLKTTFKTLPELKESFTEEVIQKVCKKVHSYYSLKGKKEIEK